MTLSDAIDAARAGRTIKLRCPGHDDKNPSLSVLPPKEDGWVRLNCHAGCSLDQILTGAGLSRKDLAPPKTSTNPANAARRICAEYDYRDEEGTLLFQAVRYDPKDFRQRRPDGNGGWIWNLNGVRKILFRLSDVLQAIADQRPVVITEGEKDALSLIPKGWQATCNPMGAGKWEPGYTETLRGADVVVVPDNDPAGEKHLAVVTNALQGNVARLRVLRLPQAVNGSKVKDASDFFAAGGTIDQFQKLIDQTPDWTPAEEESKALTETIPTANLAPESIFFSGATRSWWVRTPTDTYVEMDKPLVVKELIRLGLSPKSKDDGLSEIDQFLLRTTKDPVAYSGPLAGHKAGPIDHPNGRILVTAPCRPLQGIDAPCSDILQWLHQLANRDERQFHTLLLWMHLRRRALLKGTWRAGQLLVLAGPAGCGKSFLQSKIITPLLGGRIARPYRYMHGGTEFNAELFAAEHLSIEDESPARDLASRRALGNHVKSMLFSAVQQCHPKGRTPINITPIWAMSLSVNEEPENLMVLPPIDETLADKLIILKCRKPEPPPGHPEEMQALLQMVDRELPAFAHYLDTLSIPPDYAEPRTGLRHYHNPEIVEALQGLSPEAKLDQLITAAFFQDSTEWEGKSLELETALTRWDSPWRHEAQRLLSYNTACGVYLARLATAMPDRYRKRIVHGDPRWRILAPKGPPSPYEPE
jgi:hypothetical protein